MLDHIETGYRYEGMLASAASHELYTPIAAQRTILEVALSDPEADTQGLRRACEAVLDQNRRLERVLNAVFALGRLRRTGNQEDVVPVAIEEILTKVIAETHTGDVTITTQLDPVVVNAGSSGVEILFRNLFANAISHNVTGGWVTVVLKRDQIGESAAARLIVENSCALEDEASLDELRKPFRRGESPRSEWSASVGLGLAVVDVIASQCGWPLTIAVPKPGTFVVSVVMAGPAQLAEAGDEPAKLPSD